MESQKVSISRSQKKNWTFQVNISHNVIDAPKEVLLSFVLCLGVPGIFDSDLAMVKG